MSGHQSASHSLLAHFQELRQSGGEQVTFESPKHLPLPYLKKDFGVPRVTDEKYPSPDKVLWLALLACLLCAPIGFAAVIFAVLANVERAHMTSTEPPETQSPALSAEGVAGVGVGGIAGPAAAVGIGSESHHAASSRAASHRTSVHLHSGAGGGGLHEGGFPHSNPHPHPHLLATDALLAGLKEKPHDVHRRRMGRLNRYAFLLASAGLLAGILILIAWGVILMYYLTRTKCPLCARQTWSD